MSTPRRSLFLRSLAVAAVAFSFSTSLSACSRNDGRTLRPPTGAQTDSVQQTTTSLVETTVPGIVFTTPMAEGQPVDVRYTCDGANVSPELSWAGGPSSVAAWAVVLTDLDAPEYAHWVVANIPVSQMSIGENYADPLAVVAKNSRGTTGYTGPCPPKGKTHKYSLTLYALSQILEAQTGDPAPGLIAAIEGAALQSSYVTFTSSR